jgi:hypothetical protein
MPEFTYEESDNYMAMEEAKASSDGELKKKFFECLRDIKQRGFNNANGMWRDTLIREMEKRGIYKNGRVINA